MTISLAMSLDSFSSIVTHGLAMTSFLSRVSFPGRLHEDHSVLARDIAYTLFRRLLVKSRGQLSPQL